MEPQGAAPAQAPHLTPLAGIRGEHGPDRAMCGEVGVLILS